MGGGRRSKEHGGHKAGNGTGGGSFLDGRVRSCAGWGGRGFKRPSTRAKNFRSLRFVFSLAPCTWLKRLLFIVI